MHQRLAGMDIHAGEMTRVAIDSSRLGKQGSMQQCANIQVSSQPTVCHAFDTKLCLAVPWQAILLVLQCSNCIIMIIL